MFYTTQGEYLPDLTYDHVYIEAYATRDLINESDLRPVV